MNDQGLRESRNVRRLAANFKESHKNWNAAERILEHGLTETDLDALVRRCQVDALTYFYEADMLTAEELEGLIDLRIRSEAQRAS